MDTEPKNPELTAGVICGGSGVQGKRPPLVLMRLEHLQSLPYPMSLVGMVLCELILRLQRDPACIPQRVFIMLSQPLCPFWRHWFVTFAFVPLTQPDYVFGSGWYCTDWAWFGLAILTIVDGTLDPGAEAGAMLFGQFVDELSEDVPV